MRLGAMGVVFQQVTKAVFPEPAHPRLVTSSPTLKTRNRQRPREDLTPPVEQVGVVKAKNFTVCLPRQGRLQAGKNFLSVTECYQALQKVLRVIAPCDVKVQSSKFKVTSDSSEKNRPSI